MSRSFAAFFLIAVLQSATPQSAASIEQLQSGFQAPPDDARIMMRWWWFGPSVAKERLDREMRTMKEGGIGGFEVQPVYPLALDDEKAGIRNLPYLSPEFLDALQFTAEKAREYGLRMDLTLGSGWPFGGPHVPVSQAASRLRVERVKAAAMSRRVPIPDITTGERLIAAFIDGKELKEIRDGAAWVADAQAAPVEVQFFIASRTGQMVKRAAVGGEGFVFDHYVRAATDDYLKTVGEPMLQALRARMPYAVFCDSLEVFSADWTPAFLTEFERRRGYDLKPHLPQLVSGDGGEAAEVRYDWGRTMTELLNERFLSPMQEWSRQHGTRFRIQDYGSPPATLASNVYADLPEGEEPHWKNVRSARWASSASHLMGRNVTSSETWTWLHSPSFRATPLDIKAEADLHFLQGINQLIGHGWPYTPEGVEYPGWRLYAAGVFNDSNPWWIVMPDVARYLQRVSYLLRQGRPANDVAFYLPNADAYAEMRPGRVDMIRALDERVGPDAVGRTLEAGFNLDFFDDELLAKAGAVDGGALKLGDNRYRAVILPNVERIPLETLRRLEELGRAGGVVIATRRAPARVPGLKAASGDQREAREIAGRLFEGSNAHGVFVANENTDLGKALASRLQPDVVVSPAVPAIGFVHRSGEFGEVYFLANSSNAKQTVDARFRIPQDLRAELWDPQTGSVIAAEGKGATVRLKFEPYGSQVVVFSHRKLGRRTVAASGKAPVPLSLSGGWKVTFPGRRESAPMELRSWTEEEDTRFFSGSATYERDVEVPAEMVQGGARVSLDFGEGKPLPEGKTTNGMRAWLDAPVRDAAVVYVNGERVGAVWCPPYAVNVSGRLKAGRNRLRVVVANTAINYMAGRALPSYRLLNSRYGERFQPQDMNLMKALPSGLLGAVRLVAH